ncbi:AraC family transcriptional regulator [Aquipseudomonas alcaligenes]|uniref:AraC family transcriptional regulator n=1 Tax=Aquipseudomonas alcaligenes TaxID=43263 RepID=A0A2V4LEA6_AQUAC|nr:AraC family transcriptional regulator [Pseudomonas alcaligenes]PYC24553.1 AraC family transcriptional regulator [Pseudomonas alcaligenes]
MDISLLNEKSRIFAQADPYAVSDYVNQHVGAHCIRLPRTGRPEASLSHRTFGALDLCRISYGGSVRVTSPALETIYHLQVLLQGHCLWRGHGQEHYFTPGELLLINPDDPVDLTYSDDCEKFIVKLPANLIERACSDNHWQRPAGGVRFAARHQLQQLEGFTSLLGLVCSEAESDQSLPLVQEQYTRIIASKLLGLLSNNVSRQPAGEGSPSFERLVQFIDDNLKQDINLEQLAQLAHMSPRSLYALFDKYLGTTPKHYIRQRKLEKVHACLRDPSVKVRNVTEVALDYGFLHLGRFSESYKSAFGELPSDTLRRRES